MVIDVLKLDHFGDFWQSLLTDLETTDTGCAALESSDVIPF